MAPNIQDPKGNKYQPSLKPRYEKFARLDSMSAAVKGEINRRGLHIYWEGMLDRARSIPMYVYIYPDIGVRYPHIGQQG